jgi:16S rRNA (cytosine967-C5)-methyltransferase
VLLQNLLRLALYQIFWLDRIPSHAAVNVSVELAKRRGYGAQAGFVNAVLRGYLRETEATRALLTDLKKEHPHLGYSHPEWLVALWQARWGQERTAKLLEWNNAPPGTFARVNTLKTDAAKLLPLWRDEGVEYDFVRRDWLEENLVFELKSHPSLDKLASFQQGFFYLQDPSTLLAVRELNPQPGEHILDLCAAPGGKLSYIAQLLRNEGRIVAYDNNPQRLHLIQENCARLGITCVDVVSVEQPIETGVLESTPHSLNAGIDWTWKGPQGLARFGTFDRVIVDAPCSNTGVMRRRVDLRWRVTLAELERLRKAQMELLGAAARLVKPGGSLVYSTCSLEPEENQQTLEAWLALQSEHQLVRQRLLLPFEAGADGAYVALLKRQQNT